MGLSSDPGHELDQRFAAILGEISIALGAAQTDLNLLAADVTVYWANTQHITGWQGKQLQEDLKLIKSAMALARLTAKNLHERRMPEQPRSTPHIVKKGEIQE